MLFILAALAAPVDRCEEGDAEACVALARAAVGRWAAASDDPATMLLLVEGIEVSAAYACLAGAEAYCNDLSTVHDACVRATTSPVCAELQRPERRRPVPVPDEAWTLLEPEVWRITDREGVPLPGIGVTLAGFEGSKQTSTIRGEVIGRVGVGVQIEHPTAESSNIVDVRVDGHDLILDRVPTSSDRLPVERQGVRWVGVASDGVLTSVSFDADLLADRRVDGFEVATGWAAATQGDRLAWIHAETTGVDPQGNPEVTRVSATLSPVPRRRGRITRRRFVGAYGWQAGDTAVGEESFYRGDVEVDLLSDERVEVLLARQRGELRLDTGVVVAPWKAVDMSPYRLARTMRGVLPYFRLLGPRLDGISLRRGVPEQVHMVDGDDARLVTLTYEGPVPCGAGRCASVLWQDRMGRSRYVVDAALHTWTWEGLEGLGEGETLTLEWRTRRPGEARRSR